jgi:hypothetical protein
MPAAPTIGAAGAGGAGGVTVSTELAAGTAGACEPEASRPRPDSPLAHREPMGPEASPPRPNSRTARSNPVEPEVRKSQLNWRSVPRERVDPAARKSQRHWPLELPALAVTAVWLCLRRRRRVRPGRAESAALHSLAHSRRERLAQAASAARRFRRQHPPHDRAWEVTAASRGRQRRRSDRPVTAATAG